MSSGWLPLYQLHEAAEGATKLPTDAGAPVPRRCHLGFLASQKGKSKYGHLAKRGEVFASDLLCSEVLYGKERVLGWWLCFLMLSRPAGSHAGRFGDTDHGEFRMLLIMWTALQTSPGESASFGFV